MVFGERAGTRTQDLLIKSQMLYRLSYALGGGGEIGGRRRGVNRAHLPDELREARFAEASALALGSRFHAPANPAS